MHEIRPVPPRLLTPEQVAELLGVSRISVIRQSRAGTIPNIKIGKCYRYRTESIAAWIAEQESQDA
jgi:excisionase family DNA binding protein